MARIGTATVLFLMAFALIALPSARAQYDYNWLGVSGDCDIGVASVHGSITNHAGFADDWSGWVVARTTVGTCDEWVAASDVQAFPDSGFVAVVDVSDSVSDDQAYKYGIRIVIDGGGMISPPGSHFFLPEAHYDYVTCGSAPVVRGTLEEGVSYFLVNICDGSCWAPIRYIDPWNLPDPYHAYVGTGQILNMYGDVQCGGFEGCTLSVNHVGSVDDCGTPVGVEAVTWSTVKSRFE